MSSTQHPGKISPLPTLKARKDFQRISRCGQKWVAKSFILQALPNTTSTQSATIGYTVSKKVGKAVIRNKVKRRLREIFKISHEKQFVKDYTYVIIARRGSDKSSFDSLQKEVTWALKHLHRLFEQNGKA